MNSDTVRMFLNGQAMSGGVLHHAVAGARFLGAVRTAPRYRFYAFREEFPGLRPVVAEGRAIEGELYELEYERLRAELLPGEPPELELSAIALEGRWRSSLSMVVRDGVWQADGVEDITDFGGWRNYWNAVRSGGGRGGGDD